MFRASHNAGSGKRIIRRHRDGLTSWESDFRGWCQDSNISLNPDCRGAGVFNLQAKRAKKRADCLGRAPISAVGGLCYVTYGE